VCFQSGIIQRVGSEKVRDRLGARRRPHPHHQRRTVLADGARRTHSSLRRLAADARDDGIRHRAGRREPIGLTQRAKPLDRQQERLVGGLAELAASEVGTRAPPPDAAHLAVGDVGETLARSFTPAEEKPLDHAHVRLDASSGHDDSHRTIRRVAGGEHERELVERAAAGDLDAFAELVRTHERRVASVLYRLLDDRRDVEEATQDVFVQAWRNLRRFRGHAQLFTWLYRIAVNEALMRNRRKRPNVQELDERLAAAPDLEPGLRDRLVQALSDLPVEYRAAVVLRDVEGLTNAEVAEALGISVAAAKSRIHRGRMQIRDALADLEED
jgi:RNA polymerase sigma-70 factor, ECF subfamily